MSEAILHEIVSIEKEASRLEEEARVKARDRVAEARKQASEILQKSLTDSEAFAADILCKARQTSEAEIQAKREAGGKAAAELAQTAGRFLDQAVEFIVGRIVDISGNH